MRRVVGVNAYTEGDDDDTPILRIDPESEAEQIRRVRAARERRDSDARRRRSSCSSARPAIRART